MSAEGIILAAGLSQRAGVYKMTLDLGGKKLIERAVEGMYGVCSRIFVVSGHNAEVIRGIFQNDPKITVVYNSRYTEGMFSSVREGVSHITAERFFILPGDHPLIGRQTYEKMLAAEGDIIIPAYQSRKGHPILIDGRLADEILHDKRNASLRDFVGRHSVNLLKVDDEGILYDIDTLADYEAAQDKR